MMRRTPRFSYFLLLGTLGLLGHAEAQRGNWNYPTANPGNAPAPNNSWQRPEIHFGDRRYTNLNGIIDDMDHFLGIAIEVHDKHELTDVLNAQSYWDQVKKDTPPEIAQELERPYRDYEKTYYQVQTAQRSNRKNDWQRASQLFMQARFSNNLAHERIGAQDRARRNSAYENTQAQVPYDNSQVESLKTSDYKPSDNATSYYSPNQPYAQGSAEGSITQSRPPLQGGVGESISRDPISGGATDSGRGPLQGNVFEKSGGIDWNTVEWKTWHERVWRIIREQFRQRFQEAQYNAALHHQPVIHPPRNCVISYGVTRSVAYSGQDSYFVSVSVIQSSGDMRFDYIAMESIKWLEQNNNAAFPKGSQRVNAANIPNATFLADGNDFIMPYNYRERVRR